MAFNIQEIRSQLVLGGARASLFQVQIANPANGAGDIKVPFMVKAAQLPASTLGSFDVPYFGRKIKIAGDRTFAEWTVTIINDEDFAVRNGLERWMSSINSHIANIGTPSPLLQKSEGSIKQFGKGGNVLKTYQFIGIFPVDLSPIDVAWDSNDTIEEFTCTFQYDYWTDVSNAVI